MSYPPNPVQFLLGVPNVVHERETSGSTPLIRASENGQLAVVKELVRAGAAVDARTHLGDTALMGAAYQVGIIWPALWLRACKQVLVVLVLTCWAFHRVISM